MIASDVSSAPLVKNSFLKRFNFAAKESNSLTESNRGQCFRTAVSVVDAAT